MPRYTYTYNVLPPVELWVKVTCFYLFEWNWYMMESALHLSCSQVLAYCLAVMVISDSIGTARVLIL